MLYIFLGTIAGIVIIIVAMIIILPSKVKVERSIAINTDANKPFEQVNELRNWSNWSPWDKMDPNMKSEFSDPSSGEGAWKTWDSQNKNVDQGKMTLSKVVTNKEVEVSLEFRKWGNNVSTMYFAEENGTTTATWAMENELKGFGKLFGGMMKKMLGKQFDQGLRDLKKVSEA